MIRGGALLARAVKEKGVEHVFTLAGGFCNPALEGFMECQMPVINSPHEQIAGHLADGHARIIRKPVVCLVGPEGFANAVPAMIAVAFHTAGALGKLFSEVNENIDLKQTEGLKAAGGSWLQRVRFGVLPQVLPNYTSYLLLRLEINVRASAILGFVGAGGIGSELSRSIGWGDGAVTAALFLMLFLTIVLIDQGSAKIRENLIKSQGGLS